MAKSQRSIRARGKELLKLAEKLRDDGATWVQAHNALFGIGGPNVQLFPTREERTEFSKTDEHAAIHAILEELPNPTGPSESLPSPNEVSGRILVRVPKTIHSALLAEAEAEDISLNQLILSKLSVQLRALV